MGVQGWCLSRRIEERRGQGRERGKGKREGEKGLVAMYRSPTYACSEISYRSIELPIQDLSSLHLPFSQRSPTNCALAHDVMKKEKELKSSKAAWMDSCVHEPTGGRTSAQGNPPDATEASHAISYPIASVNSNHPVCPPSAETESATSQKLKTSADKHQSSEADRDRARRKPESIHNMCCCVCV